MARVIAVGKFDGVHLGHRRLLNEGRRWAKEIGASFVAFTFPYQGEALLPLRVRLRLLGAFVDEVIVQDLESLRDLAADEFLGLLRKDYEAVGLIMGPGHRFGRGRKGDPDFARKWGQRHGLLVRVLKPFLCQGRPVSARHIREHLKRGEVREARLLLGRYPPLFGKRVQGAQLGRSLGYPTVNLELSPEQLRPRAGVYLAWAFWEEGEGPGLFYLGERPTFPGLSASAEIHLFRLPDPEPTGTVEVHLMAFLRGDMRFPSPRDLANQIGKDLEKGRELLHELPPPERFS